MAEVARKAGVSMVTTSFVLNGKAKQARIAPATEERVKEAAVALDYKRDAFARSMITGKANIIGVVGRSMWSEYSARILQGIMRRAAEDNFFVKIMPSKGVTAEEIAKRCFAQRLSAVICRAMEPEKVDAIESALDDSGIVVAEVGEVIRSKRGIQVVSDDESGCRQALLLLLAKGHRRLLYAAFGDTANGFYLIRRNFYHQAMVDQAPPTARMADLIEPNRETFKKRLAEILKSSKPPTAIVCGGEAIAMTCLQVAHQIGLRVPEQLSVIGFGNSIMGEHAAPALTTVTQPYELLGEMAAEWVIRSIRSEEAYDSNALVFKRLPVDLLVRESVGPAPQ